MLYELELLSLPPQTAAILLGVLMGAIFGICAQISRFCLRRGLVAGAADQPQALGVWLTALAVAIIGTQAVVAFGLIDFTDHRFAQSELPWVAIVIGGLAFGGGMVLTRGCVSRLTVLSAGGNLRAATVLAVFAIVAHATLKGVLAPVRTGLASQTVELGDKATAAGLPGGALPWTALAVLALAAVIWRLKPRVSRMALAAVIGLVVAFGWLATGSLLLDDFDPITFESLSFTAPWTETLFWTVASTSIPAGFGTGLIGGVLGGAFLSALLRRELQLESFETSGQTLRYVAGGALMGFGGVLAGGCTVGAGLSGVGTMSFAAMLALGSIVIGARLTDRLVDGQGSRHPLPHATPAE